MDGILLIDKPIGYTSRDIVNIVSKKLNTKKVGHTGTLDPLATGVLIICVGRSTKLVDILINEDKEYIAEVILGIETDTLDLEGKIIKEAKVDYVCKKKLIEVLNSFLGNQMQEVPIYSSVRVNGKKLYEYARKNEEVELPVRNVNIKSIELIDDIILENSLVKFKIKCLVSKGTYIRSLIKDIGKKLGYPACMSGLRRIKQGLFTIDECYNMTDIEYNNYTMLNINEALRGHPTLIVDSAIEKKILNGQKLDKIFNEKEMILVNKYNEVLAIYKQDEDDDSKLRLAKMLKILDF